MVIPLGLLVDHLFLAPLTYGGDSVGELAYMVIGIPICILNLWAWTDSEMIEFYFLGKEFEHKNN